MRTKLFIAISLFLVSTIAIAQNKQEAINIANKMDYDYFFKHIKYFASDELEGRDVASEGFNKAADYTAKEFKKLGLLPYGDNNTYFQKVPFVKSSIITSSFKLSVESKKASVAGIFGENISVMLNTDATQVQAEDEIVFVGYGNVFPEKEINDYNGMDVKGRIVLVATGAPDGVKDPRLQDPRLKAFTAMAKGAKGIIMFTPNMDEMQDMMFKGFHSFLGSPKLRINDNKSFKPMIPMEFVAYAKKDFIKDLLALNHIKLKKKIKAMAKGKFVSKVLKSTLKYEYETNFENSDCKNIVALLPGTDPKLKNEYVVVSAHLDHLGIGAAVNGDSIYNGMWDNATGSASVISIANELQNAEFKSKRSVIFICYTAEEKGLFGSTYFANSKLVKDKKVVANINIDMLGGLFETTDITPEGYSHSNLSEAVDYACKALDLSITDPTASEKKYLERSDQLSLIRVGVPAMNVSSGEKSIDPEFNVTEALDLWMKTMYHSPFDDLNQKFSNEAFHTYLKVNFLITYYTANEIDEIKWNKDEWVYKKYLAKKKK